MRVGGYVGLFVAALIAATIFPAQSEAVLLGLILSGDYSVVALTAVASVGNILGAVVNWLLGRGLEQLKDKRWFPIRPDKLVHAQRWYQRYGKWSLLASWVPFVGDAITVVAGVMKEPLPIFILLVGIAKTARYGILAAVTTGLI
ncbi:DedA family protein [Rhizobium laguerreae]|nr:DedA family protein [Rhizobium laguerreae]MBY3101997.1 DedA family protein [Rhizobium laguerreae]MBY3125413.1 DedA family protein [Rhizobium laguerreae]